MIPAQSQGRLVILTDGRETRGELTNMAAALTSGQVELLAMLYEADQGQDAYVEEVKLPSYLYQGDAYSMTVTVVSNYETDAQIQIWMGTMQAEDYAVHLNRGTNQFQFRQEVTGRMWKASRSGWPRRGIPAGRMTAITPTRWWTPCPGCW